MDCTVGLGGHASQILKNSMGAYLIGFDKDSQSLSIAQKRLQSFSNRVKLYNLDFKNSLDLDLDFSAVRGVLFDLGLSSFQLNSSERGFSFNLEGPLDMRMDLKEKLTAYQIINKYSEKELIRIFTQYGELKRARKLAREIVVQRKLKKIEKTAELKETVERVIPWRPRKGKTHPAAKVFQALRIEVNQELKNFSRFLEQLIERLSSGARIVAISFHSLEDRIIKHTFLKLAKSNEKAPLIKILTKKPITPTEEEVAQNFRARSAKLRAAERI